MTAPATPTALAPLLPCPFCGGPADFEEISGGIALDAVHFSVGCREMDGRDECIGQQSLLTFSRKSDAAKAWNTRIERTPAPDGWLPIESAPRDGRELLLAAWTGRRWFLAVGRWQDDVIQTHCALPACWMSADGEDELGDMTHWQPLPAPPSKPATGGE